MFGFLNMSQVLFLHRFEVGQYFNEIGEEFRPVIRYFYFVQTIHISHVFGVSHVLVSLHLRLTIICGLKCTMMITILLVINSVHSFAKLIVELLDVFISSIFVLLLCTFLM